MKSIDFPYANLALAKDQPQYATLYVFVEQDTPEKRMISCYELTDEEIEEIIKSRKLWYSQLTFGQQFHPMNIFTKSPFKTPIDKYVEPMDENRTSVEEWDKTHYSDNGTGKCSNCKRPFELHAFSSHQCEFKIKD